MTSTSRGRILKDVNGDVGDHLCNHIHLTNCIHLKNHMHKQSPILADRSLMRDLIALQRSRSLRDPSASPPSWHSPSIVDLLPQNDEHDAIIREGRRSVGIEHARASRRLPGYSPRVACFPTSKVAPGELGGQNGAVIANSSCSSKSGVRNGRRIKKKEFTCDSNGISLPTANEECRQGQHGNDFTHDAVCGKSESKDKKIGSGNHVNEVQPKTLSEQLNDVVVESDGVGSSNIQRNGRHYYQEKSTEEAGAGNNGHISGLNKKKRQNFRGAQRTRSTQAMQEVEVHSEPSVASNTMVQNSAYVNYQVKEGEGDEEYPQKNVIRAPRNGCGIPWNWSRIHHRGKSFLDMAGRSLSCGLPDSRLKRAGQAPAGRDSSNILSSDHSSSSYKSDGEAMPLLVEASGSLESPENSRWWHDYSGELGIFANNLLKHDVDSDIASEARSGNQFKPRGYTHGWHQSLTKKYMPRTFRDLIGQKLVAQALSNAVLRKKIGLLYVFYGPHGTGKTSCARIFASALNCESVDHRKPCGFCDSCIAYDKGKSQNSREVGPVSNFDFESIMDLLENMVVPHLSSHYQVFIFDDCDTLSPDCWSAISKVIDRAPRRVVFVLLCSSLDALPHMIVSRCQKFFFPKLKDADIIYSLQWIATKEDIEIDKDALKLIASRSDGSLRDAEMTLEQLSLLGQKISVPLVQELVGLISDEKLVDLLDLALSADTVNTVKNLRVMMETGVEPLALMSQLATLITDILAGSYNLTKERSRRKFFRQQRLTKEDMERLRQALKTLSEAEKQLRVSNDKLTWLTAALLQLAPDQQYMLPSSSADTSINHSPLILKGRDMAQISNEHGDASYNGRSLPTNVINLDRKRHYVAGTVPLQTSTPSSDMVMVHTRQSADRDPQGIKEIWLEVLERIQSSTIKEFLLDEGKLTSVSFGAAPTVQLMFSSHVTKSTAEKFGGHILQAFESFLGKPVTIEIRCQSNRRTMIQGRNPSAMNDGSSQLAHDLACSNGVGNQTQLLQTEPLKSGNDEIVEIDPSPPVLKVESAVNRFGEQNRSLSLVRSKVSLAHVIQQAEGSQHSGWSKRKAMSIAEKLEQENLRLEPRSRSLLCWKTSRLARRKILCLKIKSRRPKSLLKLVSCGKCVSSGTSR